MFWVLSDLPLELINSYLYSNLIDTSKFRRYDDDDTDSDEEEEKGKRRRRQASGDVREGDSEDLDSMNFDNEVEVHRKENDGPENPVENLDVSVEVHRDNVSEAEKDTSKVNMDDSSGDTTDNVKIGDCLDSSGDTEQLKAAETTRRVVVKSETEGNLENTDVSGNLNVLDIDEKDDFIHTKIVEPPTSDKEVEPLSSESTKDLDSSLKQEDSASISYSTFSRFNRRNRRGSESGEDSDANTSISSNDEKDKLSDNAEGKSDESDNESLGSFGDIEESDSVSLLLSDKEKGNGSQTVNDKKAKEKEQSQDSKQSLGSAKSSSSKSVSVRNFPTSSSSSSSDSDSESSRQSSPVATSKPLSKLLKRKQRKSKSRSQSPKSLDKVKITKDRDALIDSGKRSFDKETDKNIEKDKTSASSRSKSLSHDGFKVEKSVDRASSPKDFRKNRSQKSYSSKHNSAADHVKAAPEFDAANYRNEKYVSSKAKQLDLRKRMNRDQKLDKNFLKDRERSMERRGTQGEVRYFKDIGKLNREDDRKSSHSRERSDERRINDERSGKLYKNESDRQRSGSSVENVIRSRSPIPKKRSAKEKYRDLPKSYKSVSSDKEKKSYSEKDSVHVGSKTERKITSDGREEQRRKSSDKPSKRRSIEETQKSKVETSESSDESDKSVSSLSDSSSDSEAETWRDKKQGGTRQSIDIELEKKRRRLKERQAREDQEKAKLLEKRKLEHGSRNRHNERQHEGRDGDRDRKFHDNYRYSVKDSADRDNKYLKLEFHQKDKRPHKESRVRKKKFEELSSESDSDVKPKGIVSVIRNDRAELEKSHAMDFRVSKQRDSERFEKKDRLVIQVGKSSDEEEVSRAKSKKKTKHKKRKHSYEKDIDEKGDHMSKVEPIVNITFDAKGTYLMKVFTTFHYLMYV